MRNTGFLLVLHVAGVGWLQPCSTLRHASLHNVAILLIYKVEGKHVDTIFSVRFFLPCASCCDLSALSTPRGMKRKQISEGNLQLNPLLDIYVMAETIGGRFVPTVTFLASRRSC